MVVVGGIHGNETAGVAAIHQVLRFLHRERPAMRGKFFGFAGNLKALKAGVRFIDTDLNRMWGDPSHTAPQLKDTAEWEEFQDLERVLTAITERETQPVTLVDCHTFSADGPPFAIAECIETNKALLAGIPFPIVTGLSTLLKGTLSHHFLLRGHHAMAVEGGRHQDPEAVENLAFFLWLLLIRSGFVTPEQAPEDIESHWNRLLESVHGLPRMVDVRFRHRIEPGDAFEMNPGFRNFDMVREGMPLARDRNGTIHAPMDGCILMPLYQGQGTDGFFVAENEILR